MPVQSHRHATLRSYPCPKSSPSAPSSSPPAPLPPAQFPPRPEQSELVAPPYDVLAAAAKQRLLDKNPKNVVAIDLPHVPPKELGPPEAYQKAADTYRASLSEGILKRSDQPAMFAYRQTTHGHNVGGGQQS